MNDTRFSSSIHTLILISESDTPMTSEQIAVSVGTNASYIRKLTGLLKKKGIIESGRGISGFRLAIAPEDLTLQTVYQAIYDAERVHIFDLHQNPNDECIVGRYIRPVLIETFQAIEEKAEQELQAITLSDCIENMRERLTTKEKGK